MNSQNSSKAAVTLALVSLGYFCSYPFKHTFTGGLLTSGCGAAMIGGLADWFAVTALFRKPLGIPYRTAIIPRNREKIMNDIVAIVINDLLTPENIRDTLKNYRFSAVLLQYVQEQEGRKRLKKFLDRMAKDVLAGIDAAKLAPVLAPILKKSLAEAEIAPYLARAVRWAVKNGHADRAINFLIYELLLIAGSEQAKTMLTSFITEVRTVYEKDHGARKFAWLGLELLGFSTERLVEMAQDRWMAWLEAMRDISHPARQKLRDRLNEWAGRLLTEDSLRQSVENWERRWLPGEDRLRQYIAELIRRLQANWAAATTASPGAKAGWQKAITFRPFRKGQAVLRRNPPFAPAYAGLSGWIDAQLAAWLAKYRHDEKLRDVVDKWIREILIVFFNRHHHHIGRMVKDKLSRLTDEMLVNFIEGKVGNDLQMIRINGSIVGGSVGMAIFLLYYWLTGLGV